MTVVPYRNLETLFLDAGNTLLSIDFPWVCEELRRRGVECDVVALRRAEAAARPAVARELERLSRIEHTSTFPFYLRTILARLLPDSEMPTAERERLAADLAIALKAEGTVRLWSYVLPGVREALRDLKDAQLTLVAVSNSDGTVERALRQVGLLQWFDAVVDSTIVGFEKPDPRIFEHALRLVDANPIRTLHVGDLYEIDVKGAQAAGIHAALVDPFDDWSHVDCERVVDLTDLTRKIVTVRKSES